jgi:immune inhibitor A
MIPIFRPVPVPPDPDVLAILYMRYLREAKELGLTFKQFLKIAAYFHPSDKTVGMDDNAQFKAGPAGAELFPIPQYQITGELRVKVLLADFSDMKGHRDPRDFEGLLFANNLPGTGSMRDYFSEVSCGKVEVTGSVHGWFRMPKEYGYYHNGQSGFGQYPQNCQRLAEDAVNAAMESGVEFEPELDKIGHKQITALFIVHAGRGAEKEMSNYGINNNIWSHKWNLNNPVKVPSGLEATVYLTVHQESKIGVCTHELGHLAFQWGDFYDWNETEDGYWDGAGLWDLMAAGSYNGAEARPAHPVGLHKSQHGWIDVDVVKKSQSVVIPPFTAASGKVVKVVSKAYEPKQYLLLENRQPFGFDADLPGFGLLVWRVDEPKENVTPFQPGLYLIQADGKHQLDDRYDWNAGDKGDPFPGTAKRDSLGDEPDEKGISTTFTGGKRSGIVLKNIKVLESGDISLDVEIK